MNKSALLLPLIALGLSAGCASPDGVWYFEFGETEISDQDSDCSENFNEASCYSDATGSSSWDYEESGEVSPMSRFGEIVDGPNGDSYLIIGDEVYVGDRVGGGFVFEWEHFDRTEEEASHDSGYRLTHESDSTSITRLILNRSGDTMTGVVETETTLDNQWTETDRWYSSGDAPYYGEIGNKVSLDGYDSNYADDTDCSSEPCRVEVETTLVSQTPVLAFQTGADSDAFDGLQYAGQNEGVDLE